MKVTGWLTPAGEFIQCKMYEHMELVKTNPVFIQFEPKIQAVLDNLERLEKQCQEDAEREGNSNAEWHLYEMASDRAPDEIWQLLLNRGFIRVGESDDSLHFEGRPNHIKKQHQICKDLADSYELRRCLSHKNNGTEAIMKHKLLELPECKMMARMVKKLNNEWKHLPPLTLEIGETSIFFAEYDSFKLTVEVSKRYLTEVPLSQPFWKLITLHEYRHHIQLYDECFDLRTLSRYWNWKKEYTLLEWDADRWACSEFFAKYCKGTQADIDAIGNFLSTKKEIALKFSRKDYG